jgi:hypothetical protein
MSDMGAVDTFHGAPTLTLNDGGTATYDAGQSTATTLAFDYTVAVTDTSVPSLAVSAVNLDGAVIQSPSGVAAASSLSVTGLSQSGPQVVNPTTLTFSDITGHPHFLTSYTSGEFTIQVGGRNAFGDWSDVSPIGSTGSYLSGDASGETFTLTNSVRTFGIHSIDLNGDSGAGTGVAVTYTFTGADALGGLHTASFTTDAVWGWQTFDLPWDFSTGLTSLSFTTSSPGFADFDNVVLDTPFVPAVTSITALPTNGDLGPGKKVTFSVTMSDSVTVTGGTPFLTLNDGGQAIYAGGSGTNVLTFVYKVGALGSGQNISALAVIGFNANSASVLDAHIATDSADLSGVVGFASGPQIDTTAPTVASIATSGAGIDGGGNGLLGAGATVTLVVDFSENVSVAGGTPSLKLSNGGTATYAGGLGTDAFAFTYVTAVGQNTTDLAVKSLALNGASITDGAGNKAVLAGAATNPDGILQIDAGPKIVTLASGVIQTTTYNLDGSIHDIGYGGITGQAYASYDVLYGSNGKPASAIYSDGMTAAWSYYPNNVLEEIQYQNVAGKPYTALEDDYDTSGKLAISNVTNGNGSHTITGHQDGLTINGTAGNDTIIGGGLNETFSFTGPFGHDTLADFASHISGPGHDTLSLPQASFQNLTQVMASTIFSGSGALIIADGTDTVSVPGLTQAAMLANPGSFSFHA